jgi:hypothetical protein
MGLDIFLGANNQAELDAGDFDPSAHDLSRTFCYFMCRRGAIEGVPELDQIGYLTGIDISPLYDMENYMLPEDVESMLEFEKDEAEKFALQERANAAAMAIAGNINQVTATVQALLTQLALITDLPNRLLPDPTDTLQSASYFADFFAAKRNKYDNTFGQDLRNFKRFLDYAKSMGSETVFFVYG